MFLVPTDTPGVQHRAQRRAVRRADERGLPRAHPLRRRAGPRRAAAGRRGPGLRHRPDPSGRRADPPRHADDRHGPEGHRHDVRAGAEPRDRGQPPGRQAVRAGLHRRLLRPADPVPAASSSTRRGRSTSTTTTSGSARTSRRPRWSCPTVLHDIAWRAMQVHGALGHDQRDAVLPDDPRRRRDGPRRRADRGAQGDRRPPGAPRLHPERRRVAHAMACRSGWKRPGRSSPSTWSWRWGTCERHCRDDDTDDRRRRQADRLAGRARSRRRRATGARLHLGRQPERDLRAAPRRPALRHADPPAQRAGAP